MWQDSLCDKHRQIATKKQNGDNRTPVLPETGNSINMLEHNMLERFREHTYGRLKIFFLIVFFLKPKPVKG